MTDVYSAYDVALGKLVEITEDYNTEPAHRFAAIDRITELYRTQVMNERTAMILADKELVRLVYEDGKAK